MSEIKKTEKMNWTSPTLTFSDLDLNLEEIYLNLGYGGQLPDEQFVEMINQLIEQIGDFCIPCCGFTILPGIVPDHKHIELNQTRIKVGSVIARNLVNSTYFAVFVATAGEEFDQYLEQLKADGDIVSEFLVYSIGSEIAEATVRFITKQINQEAQQMGFNITHSYSPGHCSWHVREQHQLFSILPDKPCGISLNESSLMHPVKSISGIIGLGKEVEISKHGCEICGMKTCYKRKTATKD